MKKIFYFAQIAIMSMVFFSNANAITYSRNIIITNTTAYPINNWGSGGEAGFKFKNLPSTINPNQSSGIIANYIFASYATGYLAYEFNNQFGMCDLIVGFKTFNAGLWYTVKEVGGVGLACCGTGNHVYFFTSGYPSPCA